MKSILLTSTALIALGGAAFAEAHATVGTTWAADGEFGYNEEVEGGFYFSGGLAVEAAAALNADITAGIRMDVDLGFSPNDEVGSDGGSFSNISIDGSDFVIFVESDMASAYIGDTETASQQIWSGTTNMEQDGFLEVGDVDDGADDGDFVDGVLRGDLNYGAITASVSFFFADGSAGDASDDLDGLTGMQVGASGEFGMFTVGAVYQEEVSDAIVNAVDTSNEEDGIIGQDDLAADGNGSIDEIFGVFASTTFSGFDVAVAYASNQTTDEDSLGLGVGYTIGDIEVSAFYSAESAVDDNYGVQAAYDNGSAAVTAYFHDGNDEEIGIEGSYDLNNGLIVYAGYIQNDGDSDATETYIAAEYDLGGGASLIAAYGETGDTYTGGNDEIGNAFEVNEGTTVAVSFSF